MTNEVLDRNEQDITGALVWLIRRYAIWLSVFLVIETILRAVTGPLIGYLQDSFGLSLMDTAQFTMFWSLPIYVGNIVLAIMVYQDMQKTNTVSGPIVILTLFFNEIGVCFFLLTVLYKELMSIIQSSPLGPQTKN
jgi:hypothetical protein